MHVFLWVRRFRLSNKGIAFLHLQQAGFCINTAFA